MTNKLFIERPCLQYALQIILLLRLFHLGTAFESTYCTGRCEWYKLGTFSGWFHGWSFFQLCNECFFSWLNIIVHSKFVCHFQSSDVLLIHLPRLSTRCRHSLHIILMKCDHWIHAVHGGDCYGGHLSFDLWSLELCPWLHYSIIYIPCTSHLLERYTLFKCILQWWNHLRVVIMLCSVFRYMSIMVMLLIIYGCSCLSLGYSNLYILGE